MDDRRRGWLLAASGMLLVSTDSFFIRWAEAEARDIVFLVALFSLPMYLLVGLRSAPVGPRTAFRAYPVPLIAVAVGDKRLVVGQRAEETREELFDRSVDERELTNLLAEQPEVAAELRALVQEYLESRPAPWGSGAISVEIDEMEMDQLRALGYR